MPTTFCARDQHYSQALLPVKPKAGRVIVRNLGASLKPRSEPDGIPLHARIRIVTMAILVDDPLWANHGTYWAHLVSDTDLDELHAFASRAGIPRRAFDADHYDVPIDRIDALIALGAQRISSRELVRRLLASGLRVRPKDRLPEP